MSTEIKTRTTKSRRSQARRRPAPPPTLPSIEPGLPITIAVDTEYLGARTLLTQCAVRLDDHTVAVQLYRHGAIPAPPEDFNPNALIESPAYRPHLDRLAIRPVRRLHRRLSPAEILADLLDQELEPLGLAAGRALLADLREDAPHRPSNAVWDQRKRRWRVPSWEVTLVGHYLTADLLRLFGAEFLADLLTPAEGRAPVELAGRKTPGFFVRGSDFGLPTLEYARAADGRLFGIRIAVVDTTMPFGKGSLDAHSRTFLGLSKSEALTSRDKANMRRTFRNKTAEAYDYAVTDVLHTLLVHERMRRVDRELQGELGVPEAERIPMRPTLGRRVADSVAGRAVREATGSTILADARKVHALMREGGPGHFERNPGVSRFGEQSGVVHGGLLLTRSPSRFWHEAPGMLRDVDMSGCYGTILAGMDVYWGRPLVLEPGGAAMSLAGAVRRARGLADPDGWYARVSGPIAAAPNALIPSTDGARTTAEFRGRLRRRGRVRKAELGPGRLYARVVRWGVVTEATWRLIQALPPALRADYEALTVDALVVYRRRHAASGGPAYDRLVAELGEDDVPWASELDEAGLRVVTAERLDASYATLRSPIGGLASRLIDLRAGARRDGGKGGGMDLALKLQVNSLYGALAGRHQPAGNVVAANVVTAAARAEAFALTMSLNAIQTITDGVTYRRDQIPACTFAECLEICPDYPVHRAEADSGIPFLDPSSIPTDDAGFAAWYRGHVLRFFGTDDPGFAATVAAHALEHKPTGAGGPVAFDALAVDGPGNYAKALADPEAEGGFRVAEFKARSCGPASREALGPWLVETYARDRLEELPPIVEDEVLLRRAEATRRARAALRAGREAVFLPMGLASKKVINYRILKASAFVFDTPEQRRAIERQVGKFEQAHGCGLEALALRRGYKGRPSGSLSAVAEAVEAVVRAGKHDLAKALNLGRPGRAVREAAEARRAELEERREGAREALHAAIDVAGKKPGAVPTGLILRGPAERVADPR